MVSLSMAVHHAAKLTQKTHFLSLFHHLTTRSVEYLNVFPLLIPIKARPMWQLSKYVFLVLFLCVEYARPVRYLTALLLSVN